MAAGRVWENDGGRGLCADCRAAGAVEEEDKVVAVGTALERAVTSSFHCWRKRESSDSSAIAGGKCGLVG